MGDFVLPQRRNWLLRVHWQLRNNPASSTNNRRLLRQRKGKDISLWMFDARFRRQGGVVPEDSSLLAYEGFVVGWMLTDNISKGRSTSIFQGQAVPSPLATPPPKNNTKPYDTHLYRKATWSEATNTQPLTNEIQPTSRASWEWPPFSAYQPKKKFFFYAFLISLACYFRY
jgi:hypothetical protein